MLLTFSLVSWLVVSFWKPQLLDMREKCVQTLNFIRENKLLTPSPLRLYRFNLYLLYLYIYIWTQVCGTWIWNYHFCVRLSHRRHMAFHPVVKVGLSTAGSRTGHHRHHRDCFMMVSSNTLPPFWMSSFSSLATIKTCFPKQVMLISSKLNKLIHQFLQL